MRDPRARSSLRGSAWDGSSCRPSLLEPATEIKRAADLGSPTLEQLVYAEFLRSGELDRHLRRMRVLYRRRRDTLLAALARHCPRWQPHGAAAGLHLLVELPDGATNAGVAQAAATRSVRVYPLSDYRFIQQGPPAIVLGYACLTAREIKDAVARLAALPTGAQSSDPASTGSKSRTS